MHNATSIQDHLLRALSAPLRTLPPQDRRQGTGTGFSPPPLSLSLNPFLTLSFSSPLLLLSYLLPAPARAEKLSQRIFLCCGRSEIGGWGGSSTELKLTSSLKLIQLLRSKLAGRFPNAENAFPTELRFFAGTTEEDMRQ